MRFKPLSDKELQALNLIEAGTYDFEVLEAKDRQSKSGNEMIELKLKIWDNNGHERFVYDYLLESMSYKLKHFCECTGLLQKYEDGELRDVHCVGKSGKLDLIIQKDKTGQYGDKNSVKNYIVASAAQPVANHHPELNDDIPF